MRDDLLKAQRTQEALPIGYAILDREAGTYHDKIYPDEAAAGKAVAAASSAWFAAGSVGRLSIAAVPIYAAPQPSEPEEWRDIGTAPKDGTRILGAHHQAAIVVYWQEDRTSSDEPGWTDGETNLAAHFLTYPVTHWVPLRPLPAPATKEGDRL